MQDGYYQEWIAQEREWISAYRKRMMRRMLWIGPVVAGGMALLYIVMGLSSGSNLLACLAAGLVGAGFILLLFLLILLPGLSPGSYLRKIEGCVRELGLGEPEREQLAKELLDARKKGHMLEYEVNGPGSNGTPARFTVSEHYAFHEGGSPYAVLVRLKDVAAMRTGEENNVAVVRSGSGRGRTVAYTLYTIGFYLHGHAEAEPLPDTAVGFFQRELRDSALSLLDGRCPRID